MTDPLSKRSLLWNAEEPGDAYDIRKSMIARLPGDKKIFMGDHIQMLCLFQAAEIERLVEYLNEYKLKYKEIEKKQLDRHSYETQIKQLTEMSYQSQTQKQDIIRLKEFIRRLTEELEFEKNQNKMIDQSLQTKYEESLARMQMLIEQNEQLKQQLTGVKNELKGWKSRFQALDKARLKQIEQLRGQTLRQSDLDKQLRQLTNKLNKQRNQYEQKINKLMNELDVKNGQLIEWQQQISQINNRSSYLQQNLIKDQQAKQDKFREQIQYLNNQFAAKSKQLQDITLKFTSISNQSSHRENKINQLNLQIREGQYEISRLTSSLDQLQAKLNQRAGADSKLEKAQNQVAMLSQQIYRLQYVNKTKTKQVQQQTKKYQKLGYDYESLQRQYKNVSNRLTNLQQSYTKLNDLQNSLMKMTQQNTSFKNQIHYHEQTISRLQAENQAPQQQLIQIKRQLTFVSQQNSKFRSRINQLTSIVDSSSGLKNNVASLQNRIRSLQNQRNHAIRQSQQLNIKLNQITFSRQTISSQYAGRLTELQNALNQQRNRSTQQLTQYQLKMKALTDSQQQKIRVMARQLQNSSRNPNIEHEYEIAKSKLRQMSEQIFTWQNNYNQILDERDKLNDIAHELQQRLRSAGGQDRIIRFNQQIERLSKKNREKQQIIEKISLNLRQYQQYKIKYSEAANEIDTLRKRLQLLEPVHNKQQQVKISSLYKQIDNLKKQLTTQNARIVEYQNRITVFSNEIDRLNVNMNQKDVEYQDLERQFNQVNSQREQLNIIAHDLQQRLRQSSGNNNQMTALRSQLQQYETKIILLSQQTERLSEKTRLLQGQNINLNKINTQIAQNLRNTGNVNNEHQKKIGILYQQVERLNNILELKVQQCKTLQLQIRQVTMRQSQRVRSEHESNLNKLRIAQQQNNKLSNDIRSLRNQLRSTEDQHRASTVGLHSLKNQNDNLKRRIHQLQTISRGNHDLQIQKDHLKRQLDQKNNQLSSLNDRLKSITIESQKSQQKSRQLSTIQITRITNQFTQKITFMTQDYDRLKVQYDQTLRKSTQFQVTIQKLNNQIDQLKFQLQQIDNLALKQQRYRTQITKLNQTINDKDKQIADLQRYVHQLQAFKQKLVVSSEDNQRLKSKNNELITQVSQLQTKLFSSTTQLQTFKTKLQFSEQKIKRMNDMQNRQANSLRQKDQIIDRLNFQINEQKQKIIKFNTQYNIKINSYETNYQTSKLQLDKLNKQLISYKSQVKRLMDENHLLKLQKDSSQESNNKLRKAQVLSFEQKISLYQSKLVQINGANQMLQSKIAGYEDNISRLQNQLRQTSTSNNQITLLKQTIMDLQRELDDASSKIMKAGNQIERLNTVLKNKVQIIEELNRKMSTLSMDLNEANSKVNYLGGQNQTLNRTVTELRSKLENQINSNSQINQQVIENMKKKIEQYQNQVALLSQQISRLMEMSKNDKLKQNKLALQLNDALRKIAYHQDNIVILTSEIQRLNGVLKIKLQNESQTTGLKAQNQRLMITIKSKADLQSKVGLYHQEIQRLNNSLRLKVQQSKQMQSILISTNENDTKMASYMAEIQRLNNTLRLKVLQSNQLKQIHNNLINETNILKQRYNQVVRQFDVSKRRFSDMQQKFPRLNSQFDNLSRLLMTQKQQIKSLKQQNYNLTVQLANGSIQSVEQKNRMLAQQINRLNKILQDMQIDLADYKLRYVDANALHKRINEHLGLFVVLFAEIQSLRIRVKQKQKQVNEVRRSSLATYIVP